KRPFRRTCSPPRSTCGSAHAKITPSPRRYSRRCVRSSAAMSNLRAEPCVFVIFGASGDLTRHKLLPAIFNLSEQGHLPDEFAIAGVARPGSQDSDYRAQMREQVRQTEGEPLEQDKWQPIEDRLYYVSGEFDDAMLFERLKQKLADVEKRHKMPPN